LLQPAPRRDTVRLVVEPFGNISKVAQHVRTQQVRVNRRHTIRAVGADDRQVGHTYATGRALLDEADALHPGVVAGIAAANPVQEAAIDLVNDFQLPRNDRLEQVDRPLLQRFREQGVIGIASVRCVMSQASSQGICDWSNKIRINSATQSAGCVSFICTDTAPLRQYVQLLVGYREKRALMSVQMNDTHPALCVAELMRILLDQSHMPWDDAWDITQRTLGYTNHTLLPEALEKWPVDLFETIIPRQLEIIYEINRRFLDGVRRRYPGDDARVQRVSLIEEGPTRRVRMAHLASSAPTARMVWRRFTRTCCVRTCCATLPKYFPKGSTTRRTVVTPRRWLQQANPYLSRLIIRAIGEDWITELSEVRKLLPLAEDAGFRSNSALQNARRRRPLRTGSRSPCGEVVDPDSIFDSQIKRIHEYKRQLLNVLACGDSLQSPTQRPEPPDDTAYIFLRGKSGPAYALPSSPSN